MSKSLESFLDLFHFELDCGGRQQEGVAPGEGGSGSFKQPCTEAVRMGGSKAGGSVNGREQGGRQCEWKGEGAEQ